MASTVMRIAVVTGGNKGIGYSICERLSENRDVHVILTARNDQLGQAAAQKLSRPNVEYHQLDITDKNSVDRLHNFLKEKYGGVDILVNNAGMAFKGNAFDGNVAETTLATNYFGTLNVMQSLMSLVRPGGRVVNVSSSVGRPSLLSNPALKERFLSPDLTINELNQLMNKFVDDVKTDKYKSEGWPSTTYGVSKIGMTALTRIFAADPTYKSKNILINACCPGWVATDMSSHKGTLTPYEGAETPAMLALLPSDANITGGFWKTGSLLKWEDL